MRSSGTLLPCLGAALAVAVLLVAETGAAQAAEAPRYRIKNLGNIHGFDNIHAREVNERGQVVGIATSQFAPSQPFFFSRGRIRALPLPPGDWTGIALGLNDAGDAVGETSGDGGLPSPILFRRDGSLTNLLNTMPGPWERGGAYAINNAGASTGFVADFTGVGKTFVHDGTSGHALSIPGVNEHRGIAINAAGDVLIDDVRSSDFYLYSQGRVDKLPQLGTGARPFTEYTAFNDAGQLTGWRSESPGVAGSFIYGQGRVEAIAGPADLRASDINNHGWVVGTGGGDSGFLYRDGQLFSLQDLLVPEDAAHWSFLGVGNGALAINDAGQIIGKGDYRSSPRSFIASPVAVPEAGTAALLLAGLGMVGWAARARRGSAVPAQAPVAPAPTRCANPRTPGRPRGSAGPGS